METAPIVVHYNFRRCLRICRDVEPRRIRVGVRCIGNRSPAFAGSFYLLLMCAKNYKEKTFQASACLLRSVYA
jgi:hypothetical protein